MSDFEWDLEKAAANLRKHGVDFADAATIFEDPRCASVRDPDASGEERFVCLGADLSGVVLVAVYIWRGPAVRIISARRASRTERERYLEVP